MKITDFKQGDLVMRDCFIRKGEFDRIESGKIYFKNGCSFVFDILNDDGWRYYFPSHGVFNFRGSERVYRIWSLTNLDYIVYVPGGFESIKRNRFIREANKSDMDAFLNNNGIIDQYPFYGVFRLFDEDFDRIYYVTGKNSHSYEIDRGKSESVRPEATGQGNIWFNCFLRKATQADITAMMSRRIRKAMDNCTESVGGYVKPSLDSLRDALKSFSDSMAWVYDWSPIPNFADGCNPPEYVPACIGIDDFRLLFNNGNQFVFAHSDSFCVGTIMVKSDNTGTNYVLEECDWDDLAVGDIFCDEIECKDDIECYCIKINDTECVWPYENGIMRGVTDVGLYKVVKV